MIDDTTKKDEEEVKTAETPAVEAETATEEKTA